MRPLEPERSAELVALLMLQELPRVGTATLHALIRRFGSAEAALSAPRRDFERVAGARAGLARRDAGAKAKVESLLEQGERSGARALTWNDPDYPERLRHLADPPPVLFFRGDSALLSLPAVAVVGSRRSTSYGRRVAAEVAAVLAAHGVVVASGLARGIDGVAHRATLDAGGRTLAVLGCGPDVAHPPSNRGLFGRIADEHLLITEFLPGTPPLAHHFPRRNRLLAALAEGVLVVEAARRSGALITADLALELGREVMAVPGSVFSSQSRGAHRLLRLGAHPMLDPHDVLQLVGARCSSDDPSPGLVAPEGLDDDARLAWEVLGTASTDVDSLLRESGLTAERAMAALASLELGGWVKREAGMRFYRSLRLS